MSADNIVERAKKGDNEAWRVLTQKHDAEIKSVISAAGHGYHDTQELLQTVWMEAFKSLSTLKDPRVFSLWVKRIAMRVGARPFRKRKRKTTPLSENNERNACYRARYGSDSESAEPVHEEVNKREDIRRMRKAVALVKSNDERELLKRIGLGEGMVDLTDFFETTPYHVEKLKRAAFAHVVDNLRGR